MSQQELKILHVVISMQVGGAERLVSDMVRYEGFSQQPPVVCCMDEIGELGEQLQADGYTVYCKGRKPGFDASMISWLQQIIRKEQISVVHAHQYSSLVYATPAAFLAGRKKVVYTEHGRFYPDRKSWKRGLINPVLAKGVSALVSISSATADAMATYDNFPTRKINVVHNGITLPQVNPDYDKSSKIRELGIDPGSRLIGTACRLNSIKNIPMILRSFKQVLQRFPDTTLLIAGDGPERDALVQFAEELSIAENVKFLGMRFDLPEIYPLFDVFLLSSFSEGISVTLLESMAQGVPSVVTDVGGNKEVVIEQQTGYLVPVDEDRLMSDRICQVLESERLADELGRAARKRVEDSFTFESMMNAYCQLYNGA